MSDRDLVFKAIGNERDYQERIWGDLDETNSVGDFILYMQRYLDRARDAYKNKETFGDPKQVEAVKAILKVTTLGVAALERHGAILG